MIDKIDILKRTKVRQAKLYYIREKAAKEIRRSMRNAFAVGDSIESDIGEKDRIAKETEALEQARIAEETRQAEIATAEALAVEEAKKAEEATAPIAEEAPTEETPTEETPTEEKKD
jgi:hypothetical protein